MNVNRIAALALPALVALSAGGAACSGGLPADNSGGNGNPTDDSGAAQPDMLLPPEGDLAPLPPDLVNGEPSTMYPAPFPAPPQVVTGGAKTIATPRIVPVFFSNFEPNNPKLAMQIADFDAKVGRTNYWKATTSEYGVGPATSAAPIMLAEAAPGTIDDSAIQKWLAGKLIAADPAFPPASSSDLYSLHYPSTTVITYGGSKSCNGFGGYHGSITVDIGHQLTKVAYAVIPYCKGGGFGSPIDNITPTESHELIEAVTDPFPNSAPAGYSQVDDDHVYWGIINFGGEVGDMCENDSRAYIRPQELGYVVQRTWSNAAILAGHEPCVPAFAGEVYVGAVPDLADPVPINSLGFAATALGVYIPVGTSKTIKLHLFSDADTGGPFTVSVRNPRRGGAAYLDFSLDRDNGVNGEVLNLTITSALQNMRSGTATFIVESNLNGETHNWYGIVGQTM